ncbi:MAG TPA: HesA/MoeB/ThiF family protein [Candidatus Nanoarchaeia archaeon]|nr:HesA/MoeB/ThiF family protein [Candidatus Nanoarchaeia archaeon]
MDYSRQELSLGKKDSEKLRKKVAVIVGIGALGSVAANLLARAGVNLWLIDRDLVEESNLQRQTLFDLADVGKLKAQVAKEKLEKVNKDIIIEAYAVDLDKDNVNLLNSDLVLDCTDNFETRFLINDYCKKNRINWIYSAAIENKGYLMNITEKTACFNCIFNNLKGYGTCDTVGVLNSATSMIASLQVSEAIKLLLGKNYEKNLLYINLDSNELKKIKANKSKNCRTCKGTYENLSKKTKVIKFCGSGIYQFKIKHDFNEIKTRLNGKSEPFFYKNLIIFNDRVLVKASSEDKAKADYSKYIGN